MNDKIMMDNYQAQKDKMMKRFSENLQEQALSQAQRVHQIREERTARSMRTQEGVRKVKEGLPRDTYDAAVKGSYAPGGITGAVMGAGSVLASRGIQGIKKIGSAIKNKIVARPNTKTQESTLQVTTKHHPIARAIHTGASGIIGGAIGAGTGAVASHLLGMRGAKSVGGAVGVGGALGAGVGGYLGHRATRPETHTVQLEPVKESARGRGSDVGKGRGHHRGWDETDIVEAGEPGSRPNNITPNRSNAYKAGRMIGGAGAAIGGGVSDAIAAPIKVAKGAYNLGRGISHGIKGQKEAVQEAGEPGYHQPSNITPDRINANRAFGMSMNYGMEHGPKAVTETTKQKKSKK